MSRALKCDICGTYFDYNTKYIGIMITRYNHYDAEIVRDDAPILKATDTCPDCYNAIMNTINERRKIHHMEDEA